MRLKAKQATFHQFTLSVPVLIMTLSTTLFIWDEQCRYFDLSKKVIDGKLREQLLSTIGKNPQRTNCAYPNPVHQLQNLSTIQENYIHQGPVVVCKRFAQSEMSVLELTTI